MKILFIHGLASSGAYKMASSLRILLKPEAVIAPDLPIEPFAALDLLEDICRREQPELVAGLSLGGFLAQKLRGRRKILVNPDLEVSRLLSNMKGEVKYLSPRQDGAQSFFITEEICEGYRQLEKTQFDGLDDAERAITRGLFALDDEIVRCGPLFERYYPGCATYYPGRHLPVFPELKQHLVPIAKALANEY